MFGGDPNTDNYGLVIRGKWLDTTRSTFEISRHHMPSWSRSDTDGENCPKDGYLWIEFLCINQKNPKEQASQVRLMGEIYSRAKSVISYLKPDNMDETTSLLTFCRVL